MSLNKLRPEGFYFPGYIAVQHVQSQLTFRRNMSLCLPPAFMMVSCSAYSSTLKTEVTCSTETSIYFHHGGISQKTELFITTGVKISNATSNLRCNQHSANPATIMELDSITGPFGLWMLTASSLLTSYVEFFTAIQRHRTEDPEYMLTCALF
jgi:hypothetical protein